jgi:diguanylate cyclase (GGDEF)-like protein
MRSLGTGGPAALRGEPDRATSDALVIGFGLTLTRCRVVIPLKSIKNKILAFAILATLIPSIGLGALSFWRYQNLIGDNATLELRTVADHASSELAQWLRDRVNEVRAVSTSNAIIDGLSALTTPGAARATRIGPREMERYLGFVQKRLDRILELTVTDAAGNVVASSAATPAPARMPAIWSSASITEGLVADPPRWDPARATATVTVVVPILSAQNELLGALSAVLNLSTVQPRLKEVVRNSSADVVLLAPGGTALLSANSTRGDLAAIDPDVVQRLRARGGEPIVFAGLNQQEVIGLADRPGALPIVVVAERARAEVYHAWLESLKVFLALMGGLTLLVGILAYWMGHSIVKPLDGLIGAADRIASGDLAVRLHDANEGEIGHLTRVFNKMVDRLSRSREEVGAANQVLQEQNQLLETLSVTDSLTGLFNRKKLDDILADQFARFRRTQRPFAVLMLDIDNFKALNDTYGHLAGDQVLSNLAAILQRSVRTVDFVARYGGEEFVVVLVETFSEGALQIAERIRALVETPRLAANNELISVTVSLGVAESRIGDSRPEDVLGRADRAMYDAKHAGRNKVRAT